MAKTNLAQHEQHLKNLEKSIREICDDHKQMSELVHQSWTKSIFKSPSLKNQGLWMGRLASAVTRLELSTC
jgi:hypothetical protein